MNAIKMNIIFRIIVMIIIITPAGKKVWLEVADLNQNSTELTFEYKVGNNSDADIWICRSVCFNTSVKQGIHLCREKKTVRIRQASVSVPDNITFETPIYGEYIRLRKGETYKEYLNLKLPLKNVLDWDSCEDSDNTFIADKLVFEIGVVRKDLLQVKNDIRQGLTRYDIIRNKKSEDNVLVNCYWIMRNPESVLSYEIKNIRIPCKSSKSLP